MKNNLAILGSGGHSREVADAATLSGWKKITYFDDNQANNHKDVMGNTEDLLESLNNFDGVIVAIGDNSIRWNKIKLLQINNANLVSIVHPSAIISKDIDLGLGSVVFGGVVINSGSVIGVACILNTSSVLTHDCKLGSAVHIAPSAVLCGNVNISDFSWIGANALVIEGIKITKKVIVGGGSVVIRNIEEEGTYVGNPIRRLPKDN